MKRIVFAFITSIVLMSGANASEVAFCTPGFNIQVMAGDKAACTKTATVADDVGPRRCNGDGKRVAAEAADGGDLCQGSGIASLAALPALDCKLSYGLDARNNLERNAPDRCVKTVRRTVFGDIATRTE